jgi:hypothetical protein
MKYIKSYNENFNSSLSLDSDATEFQKTMVIFFKNRYNFKTNLKVYWSDESSIELVDGSLGEDDVHPMDSGYILRAEYDDENYILNSDDHDEVIFDDINKLFIEINNYLDKYEKDYYNHLNGHNITKVIVFNPDNFSKFILDDIDKNKNKIKKYLNKLKKVRKYLNNNAKDILDIYLNMNKYNL